MRRISIILLFFLLRFGQCQVPSVNLEASMDPDIVLVNVENGDRSFLGNVLLKLDSLHPVLIGIDVHFQGKKNHRADSTLADALRKIKNDFLIYSVSKSGATLRSDSGFTSLVQGEGLFQFHEKNGLIMNMTPVAKIRGDVHESFALRIVRYWRPGFNSQLKINEQIPINYTRTQEKYFQIDGSVLLETSINDIELNNKIFLLGYIGPGIEDKYFTPLRFVSKKYKNGEPDTYGLVILANEIRTILEYQK